MLSFPSKQHLFGCLPLQVFLRTAQITRDNRKRLPVGIFADLEDEDKILALTLLMGEWFIAKVSGTWSIAPTEPIDLQKAIISFGYGVLSYSRKSFFPTASWARDLIAGDSIEGAVALLNATAKQWASEH